MKERFSRLTMTESTLRIAVLVFSITVSTGSIAGDRHRDNHQVFTDYAVVLHVEPTYRTVTRRTPQRTCYVPSLRQQNAQGNGHHRQQQRSYSPESVFVGGVIGGAIGRELSKSITGRSNTGATLGGAAIGAGLAAAHQQQRSDTDKRYGNNRRYVTSTQHHHNRHQPRNQTRQRRCTTTEHIQRVREISGYQVTYRFRGRTFHTHTDHHPGDKIPVRVAVSTH